MGDSAKASVRTATSPAEAEGVEAAGAEGAEVEPPPQATRDSIIAPASSSAEIFYAATQAGAEAAGFDAGIIQTGKLADIMLIDLDSPMMVADHNLISNLVYAADSSCVSSLICNGKILMHNRIVEGEKEILEQARKCARHLLGK